MSAIDDEPPVDYGETEDIEPEVDASPTTTTTADNNGDKVINTIVLAINVKVTKRVTVKI